jgi:hypothetical protein
MVDCWTLNGQISTENPLPYCILEGGELKSNVFNCTKEPDAACMPVKAEDADTNRKLCEACANTLARPNKMSGGWTGKSGENACCGNMKGEGGYPYPSKISASRPTFAGAYRTTAPYEICDDYYGGSKANTIDNDCDGKVDCKDDSCWPSTTTSYDAVRTAGSNTWKNYLSPTGGLCCNAAADGKTKCKNFLDPQGSIAGVDCNSTFECDCKPIYTEDNALNWINFGTTLMPDITLRPGQTYKTCSAALEDGYYSEDRIVKVNVAPGTGHSFSLSAETIDNAGVCSVQLIVYKNDYLTPLAEVMSGDVPMLQRDSTSGYFYFTFQNAGNKDCLVTVTIT